MRKALFFAPLAVVLAFALLFRGGISLHAHFLWAIILIVPATALLATQHGIQNPSRFKSGILGSLFAFLGLLLPSMALAPIQGFGLYEFLNFSAGVVTFLLISQSAISQKAIHRIFACISVAATLLSATGLTLFALLPPPRVFGTFVDFSRLAVTFPNAFALFLLMAIPLTFYLILKTKEKTKQAFMACAAIQLAALILSYSRESWIALMFGILVALGILLWEWRPSKAVARQFLMQIVVVALATLLLATGIGLLRAQRYQTAGVIQKITFQADEGKASVTGRLELMRRAVDAIAEHPLFGVGPGSFAETEGNHQHNLFLKIASESGLAALFLFATFLILLALLVILGFKSLDAGSKAIVVASGASVLLALTQSMVDYNLNFVSNSLLFWGLLGLMVAVVSRKTPAKKAEVGVRNPLLIATFLLSVGLMAVAIHELAYKTIFKQGEVLAMENRTEEALAKFESAKSLFFSQDLATHIGEAYYKLAVEKGWNPWGQKGADYLSDLKASRVTNEIVALKSEFCLLKPYKDCLQTSQSELAGVRKALILESDLASNLRIAFDHYKIISLVRPELFNAYVKEAEALLEGYRGKVERNEQLTILTGNPKFAIDTYSLFIDWAKTQKAEPKTINRLRLARAKMSRAVERERQKYETLYQQAIPR
ncbi:O-antigen ligase family protein [Candidatus Peregrinibacteria bacterium]|nr:O-antigen ligase family protein [Candidatus Peregrinibacteria bacterium]